MLYAPLALRLELDGKEASVFQRVGRMQSPCEDARMPLSIDSLLLLDAGVRVSFIDAAIRLARTSGLRRSTR
eukprot:15462441-Alexandrium_andersonii.AAC.1